MQSKPSESASPEHPTRRLWSIHGWGNRVYAGLAFGLAWVFCRMLSERCVSKAAVRNGLEYDARLEITGQAEYAFRGKSPFARVLACCE